MSAVGKDRIDELTDRITQLTLKTTAPEPQRLFTDLFAIARQEDNWAKAGKFAGYGAGIAVFFLMDAQPDTWFHYDSLLFGLILGTLAAGAGSIATVLIGKLALRPQIADWARRADTVVRQYDGLTAAPLSTTPVPDGAAQPQAKPRPKPQPLPTSQKVIFAFVGILGVASLAFGLSQQIGKFVGAGTALIFIAALNLFYRPDR